MNLDRFFHDFSRYLLGELPTDEVVARLYRGAPLERTDRAGLVHYATHSRAQREHIVEVTFEHTAHAVRERKGPERWRALVADYFRAEPQRHIAFSRNNERFVPFLRARGSDLPAWLADLAEFEWHSFGVISAPWREADHAPGGCLRLPSSARIVSYQYDVLGWLALPDDARAGGEPRRFALTLLHTRIATLDLVHYALDADELALLARLPLDTAALAELPAPERRAAAALARDGLLLGLAGEPGVAP